MAQVINTNIPSLNAQRNLNTSQSALTTSLQRLSSGLRINSAKDDAAGLGISERMTTQIRGLNQATRNANDGISLAQTGEGALAEIGQQPAAYPRTGHPVRQRHQQRLRPRRPGGGSSAASSRKSTASASQTSFNGLKLLDGSFGTAAFQVGANANETITVSSFTSMRYYRHRRRRYYVRRYRVTSNVVTVVTHGQRCHGHHCRRPNHDRAVHLPLPALDSTRRPRHGHLAAVPTPKHRRRSTPPASAASDATGLNSTTLSRLQPHGNYRLPLRCIRRRSDYAARWHLHGCPSTSTTLISHQNDVDARSAINGVMPQHYRQSRRRQHLR